MAARGVLLAAAAAALGSPFAPAARTTARAPTRRPAIDEDEEWRGLAASTEDAVDLFLRWTREDPAFGVTARTVNLRRGRLGGDVPPTLWPAALRSRLGRGLARRGEARTARRVVWAAWIASNGEAEAAPRPPRAAAFEDELLASLGKLRRRPRSNATAADLELSFVALQAAYVERSVGINHWSTSGLGYLQTPLPRQNRTRFP